MRNGFLLFCLVFAGVACSKSGSNAGQKANEQVLQDETRNPSGAVDNGKTYEDLKILQGMVAQESSLSEKFLDQADKLTYVDYGSGQTITLAECETINSKISARYKLHSYEVTTEKGYEIKKGTNLCPNSGIKSGEYISPKSAKISFNRATVKNQLGVAGAAVLKISVHTWPSEDYVIETQYVLDSKFNVIESTLHDDNSSHGIIYNEIASLSPEGHVLGRVEKTRPDMAEAYLWKGASTFASGDGKIDTAMRVYQNDGKGVPAIMTSYTIPYKYNWESYEVSPLTRIGGIYLVNGKTETWPNSQIGLHYVSKAGATCGYGYTGYTDDGDSIRNFGDIQCEAKMDVQTSRR